LQYSLADCSPGGIILFNKIRDKILGSKSNEPKCKHNNVVEITTFDDDERLFRCRGCEKILKENEVEMEE